MLLSSLTVGFSSLSLLLLILSGETLSAASSSKRLLCRGIDSVYRITHDELLDGIYHARFVMLNYTI